MNETFSTFLEYLEGKFHTDITSKQVLQAKEARTAGFPKIMHTSLKSALQAQGINSLYSHQQQAFEAISRGEDTVIVSKTASGKTLSYFLPILQEYLNAPFSVLFLFPTKALSRDQEGTLRKILAASCKNHGQIGTFDGDTAADERYSLSMQADMIISNPDMLHNAILPNHTRRWKSFLARLKYCVIDEVHTYRGAYGSHVANVLRRLLRVCALHGSSPQFICSSATIANPREHVKRLCMRDFSVVSQDGSPCPKRHMYFVNPPVVRNQEKNTFYRKGPHSAVIPLARKASKLGIRTICFVRGRQEGERLYRAIVDGFPELKELVKPYRGGLLPSERRQLEHDLAKGKINTVISTNALELGIDIGGLQLCILTGHPGTVASFWQQAGRVGRSKNDACVVFVAKNTSVDQFLVTRPQFLKQNPVEQAWLSPDNPYILLQHLPCAAYEYPLRTEEKLFDKHLYHDALEVLRAEETVIPFQKDTFCYGLEDYPSKGVNLRGMTDHNIQIIWEQKVIGELDPIGARGTLYKDAIYQHLGKKYMSIDLNLDQKTCTVVRADVDYYTEAVWQSTVKHTHIDEQKKNHGAELIFGDVKVNKQPKLYKKIRERSLENIGYGPITLKPFIYETTGFSLCPAQEWIEAVDQLDKRLLGAALYGLSYCLKQVAPSFCMGDIRDIDTDVFLSSGEAKRWESALFVFDALEGGVGYAEKIFQQMLEILQASLQILAQCVCASGCPACVPPLPPGIVDEDMEVFLKESNAVVEASLSLLTYETSGTLKLPNITIHKRAMNSLSPHREEDPEALIRRNKLQKAAKILKHKRERIHC